MGEYVDVMILKMEKALGYLILFHPVYMGHILLMKMKVVWISL